MFPWIRTSGGNAHQNVSQKVGRLLDKSQIGCVLANDFERYFVMLGPVMASLVLLPPSSSGMALNDFAATTCFCLWGMNQIISMDNSLGLDP